ncbi:PRC-barrel domain-containing protein [Loktanella salsilacus]|jgi:sporulation protein YlmC with PRC-barrel domain|uniref:Sporulation protein YlmC, PRC-barrel domain family n=1 Tax=Loktanella salsilacus TaxID=195913 RepID=A0A1I4G5I6_9RHOB|nr:PRC-barrel domain-containing protein [Loktanella salsilacus]MBU0780397.1 PRC-barrel domain-containing protein [Alphaproteobacteria bacterium]MBU0860989.1 PRC-barrel domain-containing protein [Alphaproteobacteria bacterium]MBU1836602.1 PRC-barrel domain-containing protein [Alphaproteobacteria bacterium]SFL24351.1 Sporulation protein YlmC, PRC-barrel domain family [Loktanella salsilacus]
MKRFLATTAIALVVANGAFAESHVAADGTATDGAMTTEAPATTDGTLAPEATTDTMAPTDEAMPAEEMPADTMTETTTEEMTDTMSDTDATSTNMESADTMDGAGAPMMEKDGYTTAVNADVTAEELTGLDIYGPNDEEVGEISDLIIAEDGTVTDVIVDVGGFLGLGEKPVSIAYDDVQLMKQTDGDDMRAYVSMTEEQLEELPQYEAPMN